VTELPPNPTLHALEPFIGTWEVEAPQFPGQCGRVIFEWLEGGAYLRFQGEKSADGATWEKDFDLIYTRLTGDVVPDAAGRQQ
jgi:hypothetical protein